MVWTLDIQGPNGGANIATATPFRSMRMTWTVEGPGSIEIDLTNEQVDSTGTLWQSASHRVVAEEDGTPRHADYLTRLTRHSPANSYAAMEWTASGLGLAYILDWRIMRHAFTLVDTTDAHVSTLLDEAQDQFNGDMGFQMGTVTGTFPERTRGYCFGLVTAEAIRELANIGRGFDWEVDASGDVNLWSPSRGVTSGETLNDTQTQDFQIEMDSSDLVTTATAIAEPSEPFGPIHDMVRSGFADDFGRHEVVIDVDTDKRPELIDAARAEVETRGGILIRVRATWIDDPELTSPWAFGDVWLQDTVSVTLPSVFGGTQTMRCTEISVTVEPGSDTRQFNEYHFETMTTDIDETDPDEES